MIHLIHRHIGVEIRSTREYANNACDVHTDCVHECRQRKPCGMRDIGAVRYRRDYGFHARRKRALVDLAELLHYPLLVDRGYLFGERFELLLNLFGDGERELAVEHAADTLL